MHLWKPGEPVPADLAEHIAAGRPVIAHNLPFEFNVHEFVLCSGRYGDWPRLTLEQCDDTMARARAMSLPGGLDDCASALRLAHSKDKEGHRIMMKLARPRTRNPLTFYTPETAPDDFARMYEYCKTDVIVERELHKVLPPLIPEEREVWLLDQVINLRGVRLDMPNVMRALELLASEKAELSARVYKLTGGASTATQRDALLAWLQSAGVNLQSLTKDQVAKALADPALNDTVAKVVLEVRREAAKGSTAKLTAMLNSVCPDDRARGLLQYHGASTARWAGRRIQTQNMPRPAKAFKPADAEHTIELLKYRGAGRAIRSEYGSVMDALSWSLRSFITARPGCRLVSADFANIEGRVLAWLAGEEWKLDAFRRFDAKEGHDLYKLAYGKSFGVAPEDVNDDQRQIGKVQELALGYQGGIGSIISMGANYGVVPDQIAEAVKAATPYDVWESTAKRLPALGTRFRAGLEPDVWTGLRIVVDGWRAAHPGVVAFWAEAQKAAIAAVEYPGQVFTVGKLRYRKEGDFLKCKLPSGRCIHYPFAHLKKYPSMQWEARRDELKHMLGEAAERDVSGDPTGAADVARINAELIEHENRVEWQTNLVYMGVSSRAGAAKKWMLQRAYGGLLVENATQAVARDCLATALLTLERAGYPVVMHVHDEVVCEVPHGHGSLTDLTHKICVQNNWANHLPIVAEGWEGARYRK
ncbi:hypothetical protein APY04_0189 [Hyphomicrobium sulfonivorans]|uniref:DNA-directed DNA polymerase n=2 Tax=Hyphomicrobium sulfonivorans TaxID=121290 RepID=A0A109BPP5_HYPSL|nr:hypothetical protein APY04_0189 [Hyphomicrobium sulfonivorans]